jgi:hypothetical protein
MEVIKEKYPKTWKWLAAMHPFIIIRGEKTVIVKFDDGRDALQLTYDKIESFETTTEEEETFWSQF